MRISRSDSAARSCKIRLNGAVEKLRPEITDRKQREAALAVREARNQAD